MFHTIEQCWGDPAFLKFIFRFEGIRGFLPFFLRLVLRLYMSGVVILALPCRRFRMRLYPKSTLKRCLL